MLKKGLPLSRRAFLIQSAGVFVASTSNRAQAQGLTTARRVSANDRVRIGIIGTGGMGRRHIEALSVNPECQIVMLCDAAVGRYMPVVDWLDKERGLPVDTTQDFRRILDRNDIDAILVATPDHWHPLITIMGCQAGKDVYVEKPACTTVTEGRAMVNAARRYGRVVQLGTQQRNMEIFQRAMRLIHGGVIGQVTSVSAWVGANVWRVGETYEDIPKGLDWDMWLGPAPKVPFSKERFHGWMGWHDYARGGQLTNWGIHLLDIVHWGIQQDRPLSVQALGGSFRSNIGQDNFESIEAVFEYPSCIVTWEQRLNDVREKKGYGITFYGDQGALYIDRGTIVVKPDSLGIPEYKGEPEQSWAHPPHHNDFFDCIRTRRRPAADIEQGVRSTTVPLLAGIALKTRRKLYWDGEKEKFVNDPQADQHLSRAYRAPWQL